MEHRDGKHCYPAEHTELAHFIACSLTALHTASHQNDHKVQSAAYNICEGADL